MSNLVLELRQGEMMIVNGAPIRFRTKSRIELTAKARFLFGKQIMPPDQVDSPARRIYFACNQPISAQRANVSAAWMPLAN
jgi:flagellar biosynthesis repressor protein FlbT